MAIARGAGIFGAPVPDINRGRAVGLAGAEPDLVAIGARDAPNARCHCRRVGTGAAGIGSERPRARRYVVSAAARHHLHRDPDPDRVDGDRAAADQRRRPSAGQDRS